MKTIKWTHENKLEVSYVPTSTKDVFHLFRTFSIPCNIVKCMNRYDLVYSQDGQVVVIPGICKTVQDMTLKGWHDLAMKNLPTGFVTGEQGIIWENLIHKVQHSTV